MNLPAPEASFTEPAELLVGYLDFYRSEILRKLSGLSDEQARGRLLPSGWSPLELLSHLVHMERRWLVWGFAGESVDRPWGDQGEDGRWHVPGDVSMAELTTALLAGGERTRAIVASGDLAQQAPPGERFDPDTPPPALAWILFHVLQEYARHAGHLDVVRELLDGLVGEDPAASADSG